MIALLCRGQLRIGEALALKPKDVDFDIDFDNGTVRILHGKGNKARVIGLDDGALAVLQVWLAKRAALGINGRHPIFCTLGKKPISTAYCRGLFKRLGEKVGIEKRVHPHGLRHTGRPRCDRKGWA